MGINVILATKGSPHRLMLFSGLVSTTVKTSQDVTAGPEGASFEGTNTIWASDVDKLLLQSGVFSSTVKLSLAVGGIDSKPHGLTCNQTDTGMGGDSANDLIKLSGIFTSTVKHSISISNSPAGVEWDEFNSVATDGAADLILYSGQFTTTVKVSLKDQAPYQGDASFDGEGNTLYGARRAAGVGPDGVFLVSGKITTTIKDSMAITAIGYSDGLSIDDFNARLNIASGWSGTIDGIEAPTYVDGIAVANIDKIDGI